MPCFLPSGTTFKILLGLGPATRFDALAFASNTLRVSVSFACLVVLDGLCSLFTFLGGCDLADAASVPDIRWKLSCRSGSHQTRFAPHVRRCMPFACRLGSMKRTIVYPRTVGLCFDIHEFPGADHAYVAARGP